MSGSKVAYLEAALLNEVLGATGYTPPANLSIVLSTAAFSTSATGAACAEVANAGAYARITQTNNVTNWPAGTGSNPYIKSNGTAITFATASANWGTVLSVYLADSGVWGAGNLLYGADLAAPVTVNSGSGFTIPVGQFVLSET